MATLPVLVRLFVMLRFLDSLRKVKLTIFIFSDFRQMAAGMGLGRSGQYAAEQAFSRLDRNGDGILSSYEQAGAYGGGYGGFSGYGGYGGY